MRLLEAIPHLYSGDVVCISGGRFSSFELKCIDGEIKIGYGLFPREYSPLDDFGISLVWEGFDVDYSRRVNPDKLNEQLFEENLLLNGLYMLALRDASRISTSIDGSTFSVIMSSGKFYSYWENDIMGGVRFELTREHYDREWEYYYESSFTKTI